MLPPLSTIHNVAVRRNVLTLLSFCYCATTCLNNKQIGSRTFCRKHKHTMHRFRCPSKCPLLAWRLQELNFDWPSSYQNAPVLKMKMTLRLLCRRVWNGLNKPLKFEPMLTRTCSRRKVDTKRTTTEVTIRINLSRRPQRFPGWTPTCSLVCGTCHRTNIQQFITTYVKAIQGNRCKRKYLLQYGRRVKEHNLHPRVHLRFRFKTVMQRWTAGQRHEV